MRIMLGTVAALTATLATLTVGVHQGNAGPRTIVDTLHAALTDAPSGDAGRTTPGRPQPRRSLAANAAAYLDPAGDADSGLAPDITTVAIQNDDLGVLTIDLDTPNWTYLIPGSFVAVFLDVDQNPATGNLGFEYAIGLDGDTNLFALTAWNGSTWVAIPTGAQVAWASGATIRINRADLGSPAGFNFLIGTSWEGIYSTYYDFAPGPGLVWNYQVLLAAPPPPPPAPPAPAPTPPPPPTDTDADAIPDTADNCPTTANPEQADADADSKGDACDATPLPDETPPAMEIRSRALRLTSNGIVPVALYCPADETRCEGELTLTTVRRFTKAELTRRGLQAGQPYELATRAFAFRGGTTLTIRVPLARQARALARGLGRFDVRLDLLAYDKAYNETSLTRSVKLDARGPDRPE